MPTPNDLARALGQRPPLGRRSAPAAPARAVAPPAEPRTPGGVSRIQYGHNIRYSGLPAHARLVALTLLSMADRNGQIPARHQPSLGRLRAATGLPAAALHRALQTLERNGWIAPRPRDSSPFVLTIPPAWKAGRPRRTRER